MPHADSPKRFKGRNSAGLLAIPLAVIAVLFGLTLLSRQSGVRVEMPEEVAAVYGEEAAGQFEQVFASLQSWYNSYSCGPEGVTLTYEKDYKKLYRVTSRFAAYSEACAQLDKDSEIPDEVAHFNDRLLLTMAFGFFGYQISLTMEESLSFTAEEWEQLGSGIDELCAYYRDGAWKETG